MPRMQITHAVNTTVGILGQKLDLVLLEELVLQAIKS